MATTEWQQCMDCIGIEVRQGKKYQFAANLYPLFNDNKPGYYRVYKEIVFINSKEK